MLGGSSGERRYPALFKKNGFSRLYFTELFWICGWISVDWIFSPVTKLVLHVDELICMIWGKADRGGMSGGTCLGRTHPVGGNHLVL